jgi:DNA-binding LacI/PurR family transcriptional regulator
MSPRFELATPLPPRRSAEALRDQLVDYLVRTNPEVGTRFLSDHQLARVSKLSRPTVRRALHDLHREGWIERRQGHGTFVGPRVAMPMGARPVSATVQTNSATRIIRLAVVVHLAGDFRHDWYSRHIIEGIDEAAEETGVTIELLGDRDGDPKSISRRLMQTRPDVLAFCTPPPTRALLIGEARRLEIPCIGTGTMLSLFGTPTVQEDGFNAARLGVKHLVEQGHRKIGFVITSFVAPWVFQRRLGYLRGLEEAGIEPDESLVCWIKPEDIGNPIYIEKFLNRQNPTAVLFGNFGAAWGLAGPVKAGKIRIPQDLSVVNFDQNPDVESWLGTKPTTLAIPLKQMGHHLAKSARALAEGKHVDPIVELPCDLLIGESVKKF